MHSSIELQPHESVLREVRRAPMTVSPGITFGSLILLTNFFFLAWWFQHDPWGPLLFIVILSLGAFMILRTVLLWRRTILVITTHRVVYYQQRGLFDEMATEVGYEKIQDIRYSIKGVVNTMYHIGTISLQTAGSTNVLTADRLLHPMQVQRVIAEQQRRFVGQRPTPNYHRGVVDVRWTE